MRQKRKAKKMDIGKLTERLQALLAKNEKSGATLDEAKAAFNMAQSLAEKYGVSLDDVKAKGAEEQLRESSFEAGEVMHPMDLLLSTAIGKFCAVRVWRTRISGSYSLIFYGFDSDVELATYLRDTMIKAFEFEWKVYRNYVYEGKGNAAHVRQSFAMGFAEKIRERIAFIKRNMSSSDSTALVVAKERLISQALAKRGITLRAGTSRQRHVDAAAYGAGKTSGSAVDIGRGVNNGKRAMIGRM